jgi:coenzyme F420 hydrogenase subunit beta
MTDELFNKVVAGGYCIGCGICSAKSNGGIAIELNDRGMYEARLKQAGGVPDDFALICPFSGESPDEDRLGDEYFKATGAQKHPEIGYYHNCYAGHVAEEGFREAGSSGGFVSWLLVQLLRRGLIDGVLHIAPQKSERLFSYSISRTEAEIRSRAKSRYYPVEASGALAMLRETPGRYAMVGVPCFIKAVSLLAKSDPQIASRIVFRIGIICGHLKSTRFADYLAERAGFGSDEMTAIDFRKKLPLRKADDYGAEVTSNDKVAAVRMAGTYGGNWGYGFFKYEACNFCDDVVGETADVSVGDAWLAEYVKDAGGTNVVVTRHPEIVKIVEEARIGGRLQFDVIDAATAAQSQLGGLRDRREGLAYRLAEADGQRRWYPKKRVKAAQNLPRKRQRVYELRYLISQRSHMAYAKARAAGSLALFDREMRPLTDAYDRLYQPSLLLRCRRFAGRVVRKLKSFITRGAGT